VYPLLPWKNSKYYVFWVCDRSLRYTACNAHALFFYLWSVRLFIVFPYYPINSTIFEKNIEHKVYILIFSMFIWNISRSKKNSPRCDQNLYWYSCKLPVILVISQLNLNFLDRFSKSTAISNFMKIRHRESSCSMRTERHDDANSYFRNVANASKMGSSLLQSDFLFPKQFPIHLKTSYVFLNNRKRMIILLHFFLLVFRSGFMPNFKAQERGNLPCCDV
jgi:hypothetical protein